MQGTNFNIASKSPWPLRRDKDSNDVDANVFFYSLIIAWIVKMHYKKEIKCHTTIAECLCHYISLEP